MNIIWQEIHNFTSNPQLSTDRFIDFDRTVENLAMVSFYACSEFILVDKCQKYKYSFWKYFAFVVQIIGFLSYCLNIAENNDTVRNSDVTFQL